jgi:hypothetical protein
MKKIIIITVLLLVTTVTLAALYFSALFRDDRNISKVLGYIPADAAMVLQFTNDEGFFEIYRDYNLFSNIIGEGHTNEFTALKSAIVNDQQITKLIDHQKVFLSFHPERDSVSFLWLSMLNENFDIEDLQGNSTNKFKVNAATDKNHAQLSEIMLPGIARSFHIFIDGSIVIGSFSRELLNKSIATNRKKIDQQFIKEISDQNIRSENSLINLYFNLGILKNYISQYFKKSPDGNFTFLNGVKGMSTLNMNFKSDAIIFNGITTPDTLSMNYLNLFLHQKPVRNTIMRVVPEETANYILFGLSDYQRFTSDLRNLFKKRNQYEKLAAQIQQIADENGINPERDIKSLWGNEFIVFQLANQEKLAAIKVSNGSRLDFLMEPLSSPSTQDIRRINYRDLFYFYFGDSFQTFSQPYYFISDNTIFIANSYGALQHFRNEYDAERLLYETWQFTNFEQFVANQSNITLFIHNSNSKSVIKNQLNPAFAQIFESNEYGLNNFYGISYQWSGDEAHFFTNLYIGLKTSNQNSSNVSSSADASDIN